MSGLNVTCIKNDRRKRGVEEMHPSVHFHYLRTVRKKSKRGTPASSQSESERGKRNTENKLRKREGGMVQAYIQYL